MLEQLLYQPRPTLTGIGVLLSGSILLKALRFIYKTFFRSAVNFRKLGEWAVVTGATDGIGKAYAIAMAKKGMSIVLISRTESKLYAVKEEIEAGNYAGVKVKYIVCDYSTFDKKKRDNVAEVISDLDIGVLINNVGVSYKFPKYYDELSDDEVSSLMEMNITSTTWMTKIVLSGMVERKRGAIVNIASAAGLYTMPLLAGYSAAKGYIEKFSRGLSAEYKSKNITVQCQVPFYVATKLAKMRKSMTVPTPIEYVQRAMKWIGHSDPVAYPFMLHALQGYVLDTLPATIVDKLVLNMHLSIRKAGLKKEARLAKEAAEKTK